MATATAPSRPWVDLAKGIVAILFGLAILVWQHLTLRVLLSLLGAYVLVVGIVYIFSAFGAAQRHEPWHSAALKGGLGVVVGALTFLAPEVVGTVLLVLIAVWALTIGVPEIVASMERHDPLTTASGAVLVLFAIAILVFAMSGGTGPVWILGLFPLVYGALVVVRALQPHPSGR